MSRSAGFSTIEVVLALAVFAVGVLGVAATGGFALRLLAESRNIGRASQLATADAARPSGCSTLASGSLTGPNGVNERWTVAGSGPTRDLEVVVALVTHGRVWSDTIRTVVLCG
jgi:hypothetical protein